MYEKERIENALCERTGLEIKLASGDGEGAVFYRSKSYMVSLEGRKPTHSERALVQSLLSNLEESTPLEKDEGLKKILLGESPLAVFRFMERYRVGDGTCYCLDVVPEKRIDEACAHAERCVEGTNDFVLRFDDTHVCIVKFESGDQTPYEFALFLSQSLYEETGIRAKVGVGCEVKNFSDISASYQQAVAAVRMSTHFRSKGDVHLYREFLLVRMIEEIPKERLAEFYAQFNLSGAEEIFEDDDLLDTAEQFLECNLNASETSRNLYMHRNTLTYRLDKIESATGLNIRNFSDAVTFRLVSIIYKLLNL